MVLRRHPRALRLLSALDGGAAARECERRVLLDEVHLVIALRADRLHARLFEDLGCDKAKRLSAAERHAKGLNLHTSLVYGEVDFGFLARLLRKVRL